jgi:hypothetical protein
LIVKEKGQVEEFGDKGQDWDVQEKANQNCEKDKETISTELCSFLHFSLENNVTQAERNNYFTYLH